MAESSVEETAPFSKIRAQIRRRHVNETALIEGPLVHLDDKEIVEDVRSFAPSLTGVPFEELLRGARLAKNIRTYEDIACGEAQPPRDDKIGLSESEKISLRAERENVFFRGMLPILATVATCGFLQGHVQASINGASLFGRLLDDMLDQNCVQDVWKSGATSGSPFLFAALLGAPLALPLNYWIGRRGAVAVAAVTIFASSLGSAFVISWQQLFCVRIVNGIGMGIKAVSAPILASETAVGYWRGSSTLLWQLWVACGIMVGSAINLCLVQWSGVLGITDAGQIAPQKTALSLILGAPLVPALVLLGVICYCMESPRFYMQPGTPNYNPKLAYEILKMVRGTPLQASRDVYLIHKSLEMETERLRSRSSSSSSEHEQRALTFASYISAAMLHTFRQFKYLLGQPRLRNAMWSTCVVALAQQLCGVNVFAFYSNTFFSGAASQNDEGTPTCVQSIFSDPTKVYPSQFVRVPLLYSFGFGAFNFLFCIPAIRSIDTLGRRRWLLITLPLMSLFLAAGAASFSIRSEARIPVIAVFVFLFAMAYSPGLGPIPFTLASESFPLSQREAGCAVAISVNLFFAGLLDILLPKMNSGLGGNGAGLLGLFSGFNVIAFGLIFLLVEETKGLSLEDLDFIFAVPKKLHVRYQLKTYAPYWIRRYILWRHIPEIDDFYTVAAEGTGEEEHVVRAPPPAAHLNGNGFAPGYELQEYP